MRTPLAWYNLLHDWLRSLVAIAGVAFAVVLIFLQLGFYGSVIQTATLIYSELRFDVLLRSAEYLHFSRPGTLPRTRLYQARGIQGVESTAPFYINYLPWRNPQTMERRAILVMAFNPEQQAFDLPAIEQATPLLRERNNVLIDRRTRPEFGPQTPGTETDIGRQRVRVVGQFTLGTGFGADGAIVTSDDTFAQFFPQLPRADISLGLVNLQPGVEPNTVARRLRAIMPADVQVFTRDEIERSEQQHWASKTSIGVVLATGVIVAVIVGIAIVYQVLASNISAHMAEYATLKAMGYPSRHLSWIVVQQALILAAVGFVPGLLVSLQLYDVTRRFAHIPISMTTLRVALVFVGSIAMCSAAAVASLRKVYTADPAELF